MAIQIVKNFLEWIGVKEKIHCAEHLPPLFKEGEVWWCHIGENVGVESNGKGGQFTRPVLVFKKYDRYSFLGLPLSTKQKVGTWYGAIKFQNTSQIVLLVQGRAFDYRRFKEKMGELSEEDFKEIRTAYFDLHATVKK